MSTGTPSVSPPSPFHPLKGTSLNSRSTFFDLIYNEMPENTFSFWRTYTLLVLVHTLSLYLLYSLSVLIYFSKGASDCTPKLWEGVTGIKSSNPPQFNFHVLFILICSFSSSTSVKPPRSTETSTFSLLFAAIWKKKTLPDKTETLFYFILCWTFNVFGRWLMKANRAVLKSQINIWLGVLSSARQSYQRSLWHHKGGFWTYSLKVGQVKEDNGLLISGSLLTG